MTHSCLLSIGQCAQAVTSGSRSSQLKACDLLIAASMLSFLTFTSVFQIMLVLQSSPFIRSLIPSSSSSGRESTKKGNRQKPNTSTFPSTATATLVAANTSRVSSADFYSPPTTFRTDTSTNTNAAIAAVVPTSPGSVSGGMTSRTACSLVLR